MNKEDRLKEIRNRICGILDIPAINISNKIKLELKNLLDEKDKIDPDHKYLNLIQCILEESSQNMKLNILEAAKLMITLNKLPLLTKIIEADYSDYLNYYNKMIILM